MSEGTNIAVSIAILLVVVGGSFAYLNANPPIAATIGPAYIGIESIVPVGTQAAEEAGLGPVPGYSIRSLDPTGPADDAGIREGDIVVALDDFAFEDGNQIVAYIRGEKQVGEDVKVTVIRGGQVREINVTLEEEPER